MRTNFKPTDILNRVTRQGVRKVYQTIPNSSREYSLNTHLLSTGYIRKFIQKVLNETMSIYSKINRMINLYIWIAKNWVIFACIWSAVSFNSIPQGVLFGSYRTYLHLRCKSHKISTFLYIPQTKVIALYRLAFQYGFYGLHFRRQCLEKDAIILYNTLFN